VIGISFHRERSPQGATIMKTITIITESVSDRVLSAAVPPRGVVSVDITANRTTVEDVNEATYRSFRTAARFQANYRIELRVEDYAVESVFDAVSFAYGIGMLGDAEMWVNAPALSLVA
jgi:nitrogen regulatory protein PII